ncbi:hypothetical protein SAMN04487820_11266 [Actinopolyspora mzabensis]|uniref:Uncharacterized protein n=1 Tax=Actinopolyspora mzabensis TaxID=995066 RepID=A0A1G9EHZ1_ACTMZ|nr:hypothetical protein [Actinopolyspora mzabensis]SDK75760.1 hypothetical protein SAMN04487820_11266 [Actinopolyspora mzabensis]
MSKRGFATPAARRSAARAALRELERHDRDVKVRVRCAANHRVASVYTTDAGLVYTARSGLHSHGSKDFVDVAHHDSEHGVDVVDFLDTGTDATAEDELPAACECGPRAIMRSELLQAIEAEQRLVLVS